MSRPPSTPPAAFCRRTCPTRRPTTKSTRPTRRFSRLQSPPTRLPLGKGQRPRRHRARPKTQRGHRRRAGHHRGQPEAGRARARQPGGDRLPRPRAWKTSAPRSTLNNINQPKGSFDGPRQSYAIGANDQIFSAEEYGNVIVAYKNGSPVRLERHRRGGRQRGERAPRRLGRQQARRHPRHPAPAGREHHRNRRPRESAAAATQRLDSARR